MLGAARAAVGFYCPGCGAGLRAPRADAGTAIDCPRCGEFIRVPRRPHPVESDGEPVSVIPPSAAAQAVLGVRLLRLSLGLFVAQYLLTAAVVGYWASAEGPARVLARDPGAARDLLLAVWWLDLVLTATRAVLRWFGYGWCGPAATAVRAGSAVGWARAGVLVRWAGFSLATVPWLVGVPADAAPLMVEAVADLGRVGCAAGAVLEFGVLFAWYRVLAEVAGRDAARSVARYAAALAAGAVAVAVAAAAAGMVVAISLRERNGQPPPVHGPFHTNYAALPPEGWYAVAGLLGVVTILGGVLCFLYWRILVALRSGLAGPTGR